MTWHVPGIYFTDARHVFLIVRQQLRAPDDRPLWAADSQPWLDRVCHSRHLVVPSLSFPALGCHQEMRTSNKTKKKTCWALFESYCKSLKTLVKTNRKWVGVDCIGLMASHQVQVPEAAAHKGRSSGARSCCGTEENTLSISEVDSRHMSCHNIWYQSTYVHIYILMYIYIL